MTDETHQIKRTQVKTLLAKWEAEREVIGAYAVTISDFESLEVEVRTTGTVPGFSPTQFREAVRQAQKEKSSGWHFEPEGLGFPIRFQGKLLGVCLIFPWGDIAPTGRWEKDVAELSLRLAPLQAKKEEPPSLEAMAEAIPERPKAKPREVERKLHWENSQARVQVPVQENLSKHLLLDHQPLF